MAGHAMIAGHRGAATLSHVLCAAARYVIAISPYCHSALHDLLAALNCLLERVLTVASKPKNILPQLSPSLQEQIL